MDQHPEYQVHTASSIISFLSQIPSAKEKLGSDTSEWKVQEIGDGNLNFIFKVTGPAGHVLVKQAVPYVRCVGEAWPLGLNRISFENQAFVEYSPYVPQYLPEIHFFSPVYASIVMEYLESEVILRKGLIQGVVYPGFAKQIAEYMAKSLFFTSDFYLKAKEKRKKLQFFAGNDELCQITEDLIFTDPYCESSRNQWTSPQLDSMARTFRTDPEIKMAITELKGKFLSSPQALIHGDLHTGSIMLNGEKTHVIDPEFAFYGPMGVDVGFLFGNLLMAYFSQEAHRNDSAYENWILKTTEETWVYFKAEFSRLWNTSMKGDFFHPSLFSLKQEEADASELAELEANLVQSRERFLNEVFVDSLGYAAVEMIRRIIGLAHVEEFKSISDANLRARCEGRALRLARELLLNRTCYQDLTTVMNLARRIRTDADLL